jgi:hypothetical protein
MKEIMNTVYGDKMLKRKQIYDTLKKTEDWKTRMTRGTPIQRKWSRLTR